MSVLCAEILLFYIGLTAMPHRADPFPPASDNEVHLNESHLQSGLAQGGALPISPVAAS